MKQIIIGQLMLWLNILSVILGYYLSQLFELPDGIEVLLMIIGVSGSLVNVIFSVIVQVDGYQKIKILPPKIILWVLKQKH